jgi:uncharacterized membrane protein YciS (DUF1049 family)
MDLSTIIAIICGCLSVCGTLIGLGLWLGRKLERIDSRLENGNKRMKRHSQRLDKHAGEIEAHRMAIDRLQRPASQGRMRPSKS